MMFPITIIAAFAAGALAQTDTTITETRSDTTFPAPETTTAQASVTTIQAFLADDNKKVRGGHGLSGSVLGADACHATTIAVDCHLKYQNHVCKMFEKKKAKMSEPQLTMVVNPTGAEYTWSSQSPGFTAIASLTCDLKSKHNKAHTASCTGTYSEDKLGKSSSTTLKHGYKKPVYGMLTVTDGVSNLPTGGCLPTPIRAQPMHENN